MRKLSYLIVLIVILGLIISGCIFPVVPPSGKDESIDIVKDAVFFEIDLIAGQHTVAGFITISNDDKNLFIAYETVDNWLISETHLYVGTTIPTNSAPGKFPYKHEELGGVTTDTYEIPLGDLGVGPCDIVYIAVHAKLIDGTIEETGWAEGEEIIPDKNWAMYFEYRLSCMEEIATQILEIQNLGRQYFEQLESQGDPNALQKTIDYLKTQPNVDNAGVGEDGVSIWVEYKSGVEGIILTEPFKSLGNLPVSKPYRSNLPKKSADKNAIILLPFDSIPGNEATAVEDISSCLQQSGYSENSIDIYRGGEVTVDLMETLYNYDFIYMATHGGVDSCGLIGVSIGQAVNAFTIVPIWNSLTGDSKEISIVSIPAKFWIFDIPGIVFALNSRFFTHYTYPGSFVYMDACSSLKNDSLADAFLNNGAKLYLGWDNPSFRELGNLYNPEFFQELAKPNNTLQQAYDATIALHLPFIVYKDTDNDGEYHVKWQDGETSGELEDNIFDYNLNLIFRKDSQFILNPSIISSIEVLPETMTLVEGDSQLIDSIIAYYENGSTANLSLDACTYDSSDPGVVTVDSGVIAAVTGGTATITVSYTEEGINKTDTVEVTVTIQSFGTIIGTVKDSTTNQPIEGATVSVLGTSLSTQINSQGQYQITNVPTGSKTVTASKSGYNNQSNTVNVLVGQTVQVDFQLQPQPSFAGKIAFKSWRDGNDEIYIMNADGSNQTNLTNNSADDYYPCFLSDGTEITFTSRRDGNYEIYIMNADGSNQTNLTNNSADDWYSCFSPDGTEITFASWRDGNFEIYVMNADGSNPIRLTNNSACDYEPCFSPDGTEIAFTSTRDGNYEIYIMNADGSNPIRLTNWKGNDGASCFSPDGTEIAFTSRRDGNFEIHVMNTDGSNKTNITNNLANDSSPSWGP